MGNATPLTANARGAEGGRATETGCFQGAIAGSVTATNRIDCQKYRRAREWRKV